MTRIAIGIGSNVGDGPRNVRRAISALRSLGELTAHSRLYRSKPWGVTGQPDFCNAAAIVETALEPHALLDALKRIERNLGRLPGARWGPRVIDLDVLLFGDLRIEDDALQVPHPRLYERAFALVPLAELDPSFQSAVEALDPSERAGVFPLEGGETVALMSDDALIARVRALAEAFLETDLVRLRIEDANEDAVELRKPNTAPARRDLHAPPPESGASVPPKRLQPVKADLVGIFHFVRPPAAEGDRLEGNRELGYVEALGIRNPVRSLGPGRIENIHCKDGDPVEYGKILFEIDPG